MAEVTELARAELAALKFLDDLALAKCLREKLGRRRIIQSKDKMGVELVEEGLLSDPPMATSKYPTCGQVKIPQATVGE